MCEATRRGDQSSKIRSPPPPTPITVDSSHPITIHPRGRDGERFSGLAWVTDFLAANIKTDSSVACLLRVVVVRLLFIGIPQNSMLYHWIFPQQGSILIAHSQKRNPEFY